jgi:hypothetical protein
MPIHSHTRKESAHVNGVYTLLVKATLAAAILLGLVTLGVAFTLGSMALLPMVGLALAAGFYARWRIHRLEA